jgi:hypothetical protein
MRMDDADARLDGDVSRASGSTRERGRRGWPHPHESRLFVVDELVVVCSGAHQPRLQHRGTAVQSRCVRRQLLEGGGGDARLGRADDFGSVQGILGSAHASARSSPWAWLTTRVSSTTGSCRRSQPPRVILDANERRVRCAREM